MPIVEERSHLQVSSVPPQFSEQKQRRRMLVALVLLVCALALVLYRDRDLLFPSASDADSDAPTQSSPQTTAISQPEATITRQPVSTHSKSKQQTAAPASDTAASGGPVVTANRAVLPPLEIEVVAGDQHQTIQASNPSIKVDLQPRNPVQTSSSQRSTPAGEDAGRGTVNASAQVRLSPGTAQIVSRPVQPDYPLLARQMKVQGSVILQALIGKEGSIQELQVLSGPAILSAAAREAVKQWHFKPYLQAGQPVETEARITVNFTISTN